VINEKEHKKRFLSLINKALSEMKEEQVVLLKRGDLFGDEQRNLYKEMYEEIKEVQHFIKEGGLVNKGYRHLQMNIFMKHESFFMNLFETQQFPVLFELFEFE
jgi:hypothetical protein